MSSTINVHDRGTLRIQGTRKTASQSILSTACRLRLVCLKTWIKGHEMNSCTTAYTTNPQTQHTHAFFCITTEYIRRLRCIFFRLPFSTLSAWFSHLHCLHYIFPGANNRLHKLFLIPFRQGACVLSLHPQHSITQTKRGVRERLPALRQNRPSWIVSFKPTL